MHLKRTQIYPKKAGGTFLLQICLWAGAEEADCQENCDLEVKFILTKRKQPTSPSYNLNETNFLPPSYPVVRVPLKNLPLQSDGLKKIGEIQQRWKNLQTLQTCRCHF